MTSPDPGICEANGGHVYTTVFSAILGLDVVACFTCGHAWRPVVVAVPSMAPAWPPAPEPARDPGVGGLGLVERITTAVEALEVISALWPELEAAIEPGARSRTYGRSSERPERPERCDGCGSRLFWRPEEGIRDDGLWGTIRRVTVCLRCDARPLRLAATQLPVDVAAFDTAVAESTAVLQLERDVCDALGLVAPDAGTSVSGRCDRLATHVEVLARRHPDLAARLARETRRIARAVQTALRDVEPVVKLDPRCPHCDALSLVMWPDRGTLKTINGAAGQIECTNRLCECDDPDCRCHRRGEERDGRRPFENYVHRWNNDQWTWLSRLLDVDLFEIARNA